MNKNNLVMKKNIIKNFVFLFLLIFCFGAYSQQPRVTPTKGKEFWLGFMEQIREYTPVRFDIFISSDRNTSGTVTIPALGYSQNFTVTANVTTTINIPDNIAEHVSTETIDNKGVYIQTTDTVSVYAINFEPYSADGTLVFPLASLGIGYRITSYQSINHSKTHSSALIIATEDNTQIDIIPSVNTMGGKIAGNTYTINLNRGQSYQIKGVAYNSDLTGTIIKATPQSGTCRAFAVFSGSMCVNIPSGCTACDILFEQEYPTSIWGKNYMIIPFSFATSYTYRVLADINGTTFSINGGAPQTLNAGQYYEVNNVTQPVYITANNKISVTQFMQGVSCSGAGDPSQLAINPVDQVLTDVTFSTVTSTIITQHDVNVIIKSAFKNQLTLDGVLVNTSSFITFTPNPTYSYVQLNLTQGSHTLKADSGFIAYAYGTGDAESYAYALGSFMRETIIPTDTVFCTTSSITLTPPEILYSYQWTTATNPGTIIGTGQSLIVTPITNEVYIVTGNSTISGCPKTYRFSVEIPTPPQINITQSRDSICRFDKVQLNAHVLPTSSSYKYTWSPTAGLSNPSIANPTASPLQSMWYYCTVSTLNGCGQNRDSIYIYVRPGNISGVNVSSNKTAFCSGGSAQLNLNIESIIFQDSINPSYNSSLWTSVIGATSSNVCGSVTGNAFYFNASGNRYVTTKSLNVINGGTLYFYLKIANGVAPCDDAESGEDVVLEYSTNSGTSWTIIATYYENLHPNFTYISAPIPNAAKTNSTQFRWRQLANSGANQDNWCLDNIFIGSINNSTYNFHWVPSRDLSNDNIVNPIANPDSSITYYAYVMDTVFGCNYVDSVSLNIGQPFTLNVSNDDTICQLSGRSLFAVPSHPGIYSYSWTPSATLSNDSIFNPIATPKNTTKYYVSVTSFQGCTARDSVTILVPSISIFYATPHKDSICQGTSIQLNAIYQKGCGVNGTVCSGTIKNIQVGNSTNSSNSNNTTLYNGNYLSSKFQLLITKSELNNLGIISPSTIKEIGFNIASIAGSNIYQNFSIKMGCASITALTSTFETGFQSIFNPKNVVLYSGINYYVLDNTFDWDGESNIVIEVCYINSTTSANSSTYYTNSGYNSFIATSSASACNATTGTLGMNRPNIYLKYCDSPSLNNLSFEWTPSSGLNNSNIANPIASPTTVTNYYIVATDSLTGCKYKDSVKVNVGNLFSINLHDTITNCNISGVIINATPSASGTYSYKWAPSNLLNNSNISNPLATPITNTKFKVTVTSANGCTVQDSVFIIVPSLSTFYATPDFDTLCVGQSVQLNTIFQKSCGTNGSICVGSPSSKQVGIGTSNTSSTGYTIYNGSYNSSRIQILYTKNELNAVGINSAATIKEIGFNIASITGSNIYQNFTIKMGCSSVSSLTTNFQSGLQTVFNTKNVILSSGVNYYVLDNSYDWDGISNIIVEICYSNASTSSNSSVYYSSTSFNSLTYTVGSSVCNLPTGNVLLYRPNTYFKYCIGNSTENISYQWNPPLGLNYDTIYNPIASPTTSTKYHISAIDTITGCIFNDSVFVKVDPNATLNIGNDTTICFGNSITVDAGNGFNSYLWNDGSTNKTKIISSSGRYWVRASNNCGIQTDTIRININPALYILNIGADTTICNGTQITLNAYNQNFNSYLWQNGSTGTSCVASTSGYYWVSVTNNCGSQTDSIHINIENPVSINFDSDTLLCSGQSILLDAGSNDASYKWQDGSTGKTFNVVAQGIYSVTASNSCGISSDTIEVNFIEAPVLNFVEEMYICDGQTIYLLADNCMNCSYLWQDGTTDLIFAATTPGIYSVTASNKCGTAEGTTKITLKQMPVVSLGNDTSFCFGEQVKIEAQYKDEYFYLWQDGTTTNYINANTTGTYWVDVSNYCGTTSDTLKVINVYDLPVVDIGQGQDGTICESSTKLLKASYKKGYSYLWQDNTTDSTYLVSQPGKYSVVVTDSNKCKYYDEITLSQILKPYFDLGKDTAICLGSEVTIRLPINNYMYQWQDGLNSNVYTVIDTGLYVVKATNICGSYKDSIYFKQANCDCSVDVPSAFSPNGDNVNDILYLRGSCVKNIEFYIYDRWGEKVFESHELSNGWDGTFKGKKIDAAVFTFYLSAESELEKGKIFKKEGNISLIR